MSSSFGSNVNTSNSNKNHLIPESTENFYKLFKKICNSTNLNENLIIELFNFDYINEENFKFSIYFILENFNKIFNLYDNQNNNHLKYAFDKFLSNKKFEFFLEVEFVKSLIKKKSNKFFDTYDPKFINDYSIKNVCKSHLSSKNHNTFENNDDKYFIRNKNDINNKINSTINEKDDDLSNII